jgi:hypothetical protein
MSTYYLLLVNAMEFDGNFNLSKNEIRLPNVLLAVKVTNLVY